MACGEEITVHCGTTQEAMKYSLHTNTIKCTVFWFVNMGSYYHIISEQLVM